MIKFLSICVLITLAAVQVGCASSNKHVKYDAACERMAKAYRTGHPEQLCFFDLTDYFQRRLGTMTRAELQDMLGEPRELTLKDAYYRHALNIFYDLDTVSDPDWDGGNQHDHVLLYSEKGPPDHWISDATFNLFFIIKDDRVIALRTLFP